MSLGTLPEGVQVYYPDFNGTIFVKEGDSIKQHSGDESPELLPFLNEGNFAHYLIGGPDSGPTDPSFATTKLGITAAHHSFVPHAHGAKHFVLSQGNAGCVVFDRRDKTPKEIALPMRSLVVIPEQMSHSFFNKSSRPLSFLVSNTGLGIYHEEYAITLEVARSRIKEVDYDPDLPRIIAELESLGKYMLARRPQNSENLRSRVSMLLHRLASILEL